MPELGRFRVYPLLDSYFYLDGGAMFGVVPKTLWNRICPADEKNRIRLAVRPLLVEARDKWILVETGIGDKFDTKWNEIYQIERKSTLEQQLQEIGIQKEDISVVINTHLHWDHAGGNTRRGASGWEPVFPNARYVVQKGEYEMAMNLNERTRGSYRKEDYECLEFDLAEGDKTILPGIRVIRSGGHSPYHQCVLLESDKNKAFFLGDLIPTHYHLPLPYIMAFDLEPLVTLEKKKEYLAQAEQEDWTLFFVHDPEINWGKLRKEKDSYQLR